MTGRQLSVCVLWYWNILSMGLMNLSLSPRVPNMHVFLSAFISLVVFPPATVAFPQELLVGLPES